MGIPKEITGKLFPEQYHIEAITEMSDYIKKQEMVCMRSTKDI